MTEAMKKAVKDVLYSRPTDKELIEFTKNTRIRTARLAKNPGNANSYDCAVFGFKIKQIKEIAKDEKEIISIIKYEPTIDEIIKNSGILKGHVVKMKKSYDKGGISYGYKYHKLSFTMEQIANEVGA